MKLTQINFFFKLLEKDTTKYYTFKKSEHELILLKKLEDDKIFYNNTIYEKNFLYYHKLEAFVQKIYDLRDHFIEINFNFYFSNLKRIFMMFQVPIIKIFNSNFDFNNNDEIHNLTIEQYDILVKAYKYEFNYEPKIDLLNKYKRYSETNKPKIKDLFEDWFYIIGWQSIKPVYPTFSLSLHAHYDDDNLNFRPSYHPLDEGTRMKLEWLDEYDEQKKYSEFDINCKTNSYYTRYIPYNEVYNKNYPDDKKFKTDLIHINDFTEEELQENYNNMINNEQTAKQKWEFIMLNEKNRTTVLNFFEELEIIEVTQEKLVYWFHFYETQDSDILLQRKVETLVLQALNDPRYLLIMPLVDAYFELFRSKGWWGGEDESFTDDLKWDPTTKKYFKHLMYFNISYERQYMFAKNFWLTDDFLYIEDMELDKAYENEKFALGLGLILIIWLLGVNIYSLIYWFCDFYSPFFYLNSEFLPKFYNSLKTCVYVEFNQKNFRQLFCPEVYYGLEFKRPRARLITKRTLLPMKFYEEGYYSYNKRRSRNMLPYSLLDKFCRELDERDYGLKKLNSDIYLFGRRHLIFNLRVPFIEPRNGALMDALNRLEKKVFKVFMAVTDYFGFNPTGIKIYRSEFKDGIEYVYEIEVDTGKKRLIQEIKPEKPKKKYFFF